MRGVGTHLSREARGGRAGSHSEALVALAGARRGRAASHRETLGSFWVFSLRPPMRHGSRVGQDIGLLCLPEANEGNPQFFS